MAKFSMWAGERSGITLKRGIDPPRQTPDDIDAELVKVFDAPSWEVACQVQYDHYGWGTYKPMPEGLGSDRAGRGMIAPPLGGPNRSDSMTVDDVRKAVEEIRKSINDDEKAHILEDALYQDILESIADGTAENPAEMAKEALKTGTLDFSRWYA